MKSIEDQQVIDSNDSWKKCSALSLLFGKVSGNDQAVDTKQQVETTKSSKRSRALGAIVQEQRKTFRLADQLSNSAF